MRAAVTATLALLACACHSEHENSSPVSEPLIVVSGFKPFAGRPVNGSSLVARFIREEHPDQPLEVLEVPVTWGSPSKALASIQGKKARLWIAFGEGTNEAFRIETRADNQRGQVPDEEGSLPGEPLIVPESDQQRLSTFPAAELSERLTEHGFPARVSTEAGDYLCEEMLYTLLHELDENPHSTLEQALFIHVPVLGASMALPDGEKQPIDEAYLRRFARIVLPEIIALTDAPPPAP